MPDGQIIGPEYAELLAEIRSAVTAARIRAARVVNTARAHGMTDVVVNEEDIHGTE